MYVSTEAHFPLQLPESLLNPMPVDLISIKNRHRDSKEPMPRRSLLQMEYCRSGEPGDEVIKFKTRELLGSKPSNNRREDCSYYV